VRLGDGQTPIEIARAFQVPKTSMTHTLTGLEKHKLIDMRPNPKDGRSKQVWITEAGRNFLQDTLGQLMPTFEKMAKDVPEDQIAEALPVLAAVRKFMDENRD